MEALGYAVGCNLDAVAILGLKGPILERGLQEVDNRESQTLARVVGLDNYCVSVVASHVLGT